MRTALIAIAGADEVHYLQEWIDYHLFIGYDKIFIYTNNWSWTTLDHRVVVYKADGYQQQLYTYMHFLVKLSDEFDWATFIDCDEFVVPKTFRNVKEVFKHYSSNAVLSLNWKLFGDSGLHFSGDYSIQRFTHSQKDYNMHTKVSINMNIVRKANLKPVFLCPHCTNLQNTAADNVKFDGPIYAGLQGAHPYIAHFFCKTVEEYRARRALGKADTPPDHPQYKRTEAEFYQHNMNDIINTDVVDIFNTMNRKKERTA